MKGILWACVLSLSLAVPAFAAFEGPGSPQAAASSDPQTTRGGFQGPRSGHVTQAAQVAGAHDDMPCVLEGNLLEQLARDKYVFQDASGKVVVDIDQKKFGAATVTPQTRVRLYGEVDARSHRPHEVDVDRLEVIR